MHLSVLQAIILGIVQGVTEFAPISSSGHLILVPWLFGWSILEDPGLNKTFDVALHLGTLVGALAYFWNDVVRYARALFRSIGRRRIERVDEKLAWALVIGTIPGALAGATFEDVIQESLGAAWLIAIMLAVFGVALYLVDKKAAVRRSIEGGKVVDGAIMGTAQALALQPGVSRSGVTIMAGRLLGFDRESATRFSFLLALPVIFGAAVFKVPDVVQGGASQYAGAFFWGFVSSAISGFLVVWGLLRYLKTNDFRLFMYYRLGVAALVLVLISTGVRPAGS